MSDLAERLESAARDLKHDRPSTASMCAEAAAEITRLRTFITALEDGNMTFLCDELDKAKAENARLRSLVEEAGKVVEPFAKAAEELSPHWKNHEDHWAFALPLNPTVGQLRAARSLLDKMKEG